MVLGRLKPGVSVAKAQAEMSMIAKQLEAEAPQANTGWDASVITLADQVVGSSKRVIWMLFGAVTIVLLITCANVGNLMLTRAASRQRETAVRTALGAPRWRIARQWVVENVILAMAGGFVGIMLASYGVDLLVASGPRGVPRLSEIAVDWRVIGVTAAATIVIGLLIGLPAAFNRRSGMLASDLHGASGRTTGGVHAARFRSGLVVTQMSLAVVLLLAAGLLVRSLGRLAAVDPGFRADHVLTVSVSLPGDKYPDEARAAQFFGAFADRIKALPGVAAVGAVSMLPLQNGDAATSIHVVGRPEPPAGQAPIASVRVADEGYFGAMKIPVRRGRTFSPVDNAQAPRAIVISESLANKIWPNEDPIGQRLRVDYARNKDDELEVIGVVGDVRHAGLDEDTRETIYYPVNQFNYSNLTFVVRAAGRADALAPSVRGVLHEMDPNVPAEDLATMDHWLARSMNDRRDPMLLLTIFAVLAVTIAAVGVYAVLSFGVSQRTREIGVRMALGAQPRAVLAMVLGGGLRLTLAGIAIGAAAGMFATRALDKLLFHVQPTDPVTMGAVALLLAVVALAAMYVPARRAARVDPVVALRSE